VEYWRGNYEAALDHLTTALNATNSTEIENKLLILLSAAEVAGEAENYAAAFDYLDQLFELEPFSPEGHLEAARIYHAQGQTEKAIEHLEKALRVWEKADPNHPRAKRARELARRLKLSS
jgi:tetratricopeptide (TPR) repeat protein